MSHSHFYFTLTSTSLKVVPALLENLKASRTINEEKFGPFSCFVEVSRLDWCDFGVEAHELPPSYDSLPEVDIIIGSELVYAPHHAALADMIFTLLSRPNVLSEASLSTEGERCCVIVQRSDRPGWDRFLARARSLGLDVTTESALSNIEEGIEIRRNEGNTAADLGQPRREVPDVESLVICQLRYSNL